MTEIKRTYRDVKTGIKKTARAVDGTDLNDRVGNAGDEARKDLGNLGDDARKAAGKPATRNGGPGSTADRPG